MLLMELQQAKKRIVGIKQAEKAVLKNNAAKVYIAKDADSRVTAKLINLCEAAKVEIVYVDSMNELGKACAIHVKASAAVILLN